MIGKISGTIEDVEQDHLLIKISSGVSYIVYCPLNVLNKAILGEKIELFIYPHIADNKMDLYGFIGKDDKKIFTLLNSVKSVGKKTALNILSKTNKEEIYESLIQQDAGFFKQISGVGINTAERIVSELKNKISNIVFCDTNLIQHKNIQVILEATNALINLGIKKEEAYNKVKKIYSQNFNVTLNELVKLSLQSLQKK